MLSDFQYYTTAAYPCSYLPQQMARAKVAIPIEAINTQTYSQLIKQGFRRNGLNSYKPHCDACSACVSMRIAVAQFAPNRSQRRCWQQHDHLKARLLGLDLHPQHADLYMRYQHARHAGAAPNPDNMHEYSTFVLQSNVHSQLIEFSDPSTHAVKLVSLVDFVEDGLSAVYQFYDTQDDASYGTYGVLWLVALARQLNLPYVYLGYWVANSSKMNYKANFKPFELLIQTQWTPIEHPPKHDPPTAN
jgi:leucyl-tRNA---protein transferase